MASPRLMPIQQPSQDFIHAPLSSPRSFRVLNLLPSRDFDGPVFCEIREASLDDCVRYEALSYVWGAPALGHSVFVGNRTLRVTPNCLEALRHLRFRYRRRVLWVDAICIDQRESSQGTKERNHQVEVMGDIYLKARTVLVWLGASYPTTAQSIRRFRLISRIKVVSDMLHLPLSGLQRRLCEPMDQSCQSICLILTSNDAQLAAY